jgi:hypothetical protein
LRRNRKKFCRDPFLSQCYALASPLDPPAQPPTVTGSVGSGFPIGSGDSSMLLFEAFLESVVLPSGFSLTMYYGHRDKKGYFNKAEKPRNVLLFRRLYTCVQSS